MTEENTSNRTNSHFISLEKVNNRVIEEDDPLNRPLGEGRRQKGNRNRQERRRHSEPYDRNDNRERGKRSRENENLTVSFQSESRNSGNFRDSKRNRGNNERSQTLQQRLMRPLGDSGGRSHHYQNSEDRYSGFEENPERDEEIAKIFEENFLNANRQIEVPPAEATKLIIQYGNKPLASGIGHLIQSRNLEFPLKKYFVGNPDEMFDNLRRNKLEYSTDVEYDIPTLVCETDHLKPFHYLGKPTVIPAQKSDYNRMNVLSDVFQELIRVSSVAGYTEEPVINHWKKAELSKIWIADFLFKKCDFAYNDMEIDSKEPEKVEEEFKGTKKIDLGKVKTTVASGSGWINTYELREFLAITVLSEPSAFKASVAASIVKFFNGKRVLDFCSGWGDRLLGALANENLPQEEINETTGNFEYYVGVDPNTQLFAGYNTMIQRYAKDPSKFTMINSPFESAELPEGRKKFNLVFTGPPYFDYERYGGEENEGQSVKTYPTLEDWIWNFLFVAVDKAWDMLEEGGTFAINISDTNQLARAGLYYTELMNLYIQRKHRDAVYEGVISFVGANMKLPRPIWIYKKNAAAFDENFTRKKVCGNLIAKHYPIIYDKIVRSSED